MASPVYRESLQETKLHATKQLVVYWVVWPLKGSVSESCRSTELASEMVVVVVFDDFALAERPSTYNSGVHAAFPVA